MKVHGAVGRRGRVRRGWPYLIRGAVEVLQCDVEEVVLERVQTSLRPCRKGEDVVWWMRGVGGSEGGSVQQLRFM